ncbi:type II toxin-antitoxin system VapB family antitoxin [Reyranella sp. CPCC 100927]|uniref:type II toxin-antitoxin system VapB family antitoxin n=1 Tax=Reyranella sp. CPCC 100927 TaxID=2599616 RepID=UPI0011B7C18C|nr:type II toxin-antitoxin system VapB family antitoxin [Reyranella sp. CPCC 100927]TWT11577.1 histidinol dehydrogenase [Reyranella sp. CPCC 100927]
MPLFIKDDSVLALAKEYQSLTQARSTTDAVRSALQAAIARETRRIPLSQRLAKIRAQTLAERKPDRRLDRKKLADRLWGE